MKRKSLHPKATDEGIATVSEKVVRGTRAGEGGGRVEKEKYTKEKRELRAHTQKLNQVFLDIQGKSCSSSRLSFQRSLDDVILSVIRPW